MISRQLTFDLRRLRPLTAPLPAALVSLLDEMLQPRLDKRLTSMTEVAERLTRIADELENVNPEQVPQRGSERRRGWAMILAALTAASLGGVWWMSRGVNSGHSNRDTATPLTERAAGNVATEIEPHAPARVSPTDRVATQATPSHVSAPRTEDAVKSDSVVTRPTVVAPATDSTQPASLQVPRSTTAKTRKPAPPSVSNSVAPPSAPTDPAVDMPYFKTKLP